MSNMEYINQKAEAYILSYKHAVEMSLNPGNSLTTCADAIASHYTDGFISFAFGQAVDLNNKSQGVHAKTIVAKHLERFDKAGLGWRIRLVKYNIEVYSVGSAQCWLTWEIEPKDMLGWQWTNIYGFRLQLNGKGEPMGNGAWEFCVSDQEIEGLLERCPNFLELA